MTSIPHDDPISNITPPHGELANARRPDKTLPYAGPHHPVGHVVPLRTLLTVFICLVCLTGLTYAVSLVNFGEANLVVALAIAVLKSSLVVLYFMHLRWDKPFNSIVFIGCLIFVSLFIGLTLMDNGQYRKSVSYEEAPSVPHKVIVIHKGPLEWGGPTPAVEPAIGQQPR